MADSWQKDWCPKCKAANWFCQGDLEDMTVSTGEEIAAQCWKCNHRWLLIDDPILVGIEHDVYRDQYPVFADWFKSEDMSVQKGLERPS
jgi:hypothetical protein